MSGFSDLQDVAAWTAVLKLELNSHGGKLAESDKEAFTRAKDVHKNANNFENYMFFYDPKEKKHCPPPLGLTAFRIRYGFDCAANKDKVLAEPKTGRYWATGGLTEVTALDKGAPGKTVQGEAVANVLVLLVDGKPVVQFNPPAAGWEEKMMATAHVQRLAMEQKRREFEQQQAGKLDEVRKLRNEERVKAEVKAAATKKRRDATKAAATGDSKVNGEESLAAGDEGAGRAEPGTGSGGIGLPASNGGKGGAASGLESKAGGS